MATLHKGHGRTNAFKLRAPENSPHVQYLVDTNILLLLFVGHLDRDLVPNCKRTAQFVPEDYDILTRYLCTFTTLATTPNVLTEVSNLAKSLGHRKAEFFRDVFSPSVQTLEETYVESKTIVNEGHSACLGLTDSAIISLAKGRYLLLTDDFRLAQYFQSIGGDAINFNHIRPRYWT
ncbi:hypothetical protein ES708_23844 [subsurface metagenome]